LLRVAALEDRMKLLAKKYPKIMPSVIEEASRVDPSGDKGLYVEWIVNRINKGNIRWPEDRVRVTQALGVFNELKKTPRILRERNISPDVNKYTLHDLEKINDEIQGIDLKSQRQTNEEAKQEGAKVIYEKRRWKIIQIGGPGVDPEKASQAACLYAKNTHWCTSDAEVNKQYLEKGPLYVVFDRGEKVAQTDGDQVMDIDDDPIEFDFNEHLYEALAEAGIISKGKFGFKLAETKGRRIPDMEPEIAKDPELAALYAAEFLHGRWPEAEPGIATNAVASVIYAQHVIGGRWPEGEPAIAQNPRFALRYIREMRGGMRWPEAEPAISQSPMQAALYAENVLHTRWPEGEPAILTDPYAALRYATHVIKGRWKEAEPVIVKNRYTWIAYWTEMRAITGMDLPEEM
jgi:hypothetical protein